MSVAVGATHGIRKMHDRRCNPEGVECGALRRSTGIATVTCIKFNPFGVGDAHHHFNHWFHQWLFILKPYYDAKTLHLRTLKFYNGSCYIIYDLVDSTNYISILQLTVFHYGCCKVSFS